MSTIKAPRAEDKTAALMHALSYSDLGLEAPEKRASAKQFAVWIRALLQNWRQGTVGCKGRSDVNKTNKKPWKQKGTGRARAGSARSPLWRGGGVTFGPQERSRTLTVTKNMRNNVLRTMVANFIDKQKLVMLDWQSSDVRPKTSVAFKTLKDNGLDDLKLLLFVSRDDMATYAAFRNIPMVNLSLFDQANAYHLAWADRWIVLKKDMDLFKDMVSKWS
jgi:large subunit ribosomal protein L4